MSVLETPRFYFKGDIAWDPIVTNNRPVFYNEAAATTVMAAGESVQAFRQSAIDAVEGGIWNPHGTHRSTFYETEVCGADSGHGVDASDPLVTAPVSFTGMLVDSEPYGAYSSQLFFDSIAFGIAGGARVFAPRTSRFTARYINFARNIGYQPIAGPFSVVWQASFAKEDGLRVDPHGSAVLQALAHSLADPDVLGLTVRFNTYRTWYYDTLVEGEIPILAGELTKKLEAGGFQPNPARSKVVGVVGLWRRGEPAHEPGDRALINTEAQAANIATAYARLTDDTLTLDLGNSISELDADLEKQNLGTLAVVYGDPGPDEVTLAEIEWPAYDRAAYEASAGILTLPVDPAKSAAAGASDLRLQTDDQHVYCAEARYRAVPLVPNLYAEEGDEVGATFQLYDRGSPAGGGIKVTICQTSNSGSKVLATLGPFTTDNDGTISFQPVTAQGSVLGYVALPWLGTTQPASTGIDPQQTTYMYVRTLPSDEEIGSLDPTWENVYTRVLANWNAMAPCMDNWLRLDDEAQVKAYAPVLRKLTDPNYFEAFRYMPVTRDLTAGGRKLLYGFLSPSAPDGEMSLAAAPPTGQARASAKAGELRRLSRKARSS
ncbi:MAG TPA: hypothetical protein VFQ67_11490 [Allosphingosinicella sp.]|jgi:hypothetical protein|nr:hypothetical protein [Allosphingosinicella sp.]